MIRLLQWLFHGCVHKWTIIKWGGRTWDGERIGNYYDCKCDNCGKIKVFRT